MTIITHDVVKAIGRYEFEPFCYGQLDCCLFAGKVVEDVHGQDFMSQFEYDDIRGAARILKKYGGLRGLVTFLLGDETLATEAEDGDVVLIDRRGIHEDMRISIRSVGIASGGFGIFKTRGSVLDIPLAECTACWKVES